MPITGPGTIADAATGVGAKVTPDGSQVVEGDISRLARRLAESALVAALDNDDFNARQRSTERISYTDRRMSVGRGSTR